MMSFFFNAVAFADNTFPDIDYKCSAQVGLENVMDSGNIFFASTETFFLNKSDFGKSLKISETNFKNLAGKITNKNGKSIFAGTPFENGFNVKVLLDEGYSRGTYHAVMLTSELSLTKSGMTLKARSREGAVPSPESIETDTFLNSPEIGPETVELIFAVKCYDALRK